MRVELRSGRAVAACAALALLAFASNSLLCRAALGFQAIDPAAFTLVRLACGAGTLGFIARGRAAAGASRPWAGALALGLYAIAFSFSYVRLDAGVGALVLFAVTQATMIGWGLRQGERPRALEWLGIGVALAGLVGLTAPGATAPDLAGVGLMAAAGLGWGIYSLLGRGVADPIAANRDAFLRALLPAVAIALAPWVVRQGTAKGVLLAAVSGSIASGIGYSLWYAALPHLSRTRAAALQLAVPVMAATAGIALLGEKATTRLLASGPVILCGVALALVGRAPSSPTSRDEAGRP